MWNLTPDFLVNTKEELKGRRAAIQARVADELAAIDADLEELETLERIAYDFAVKHLRNGETGTSPHEICDEQVAKPVPGSAPDAMAASAAPRHIGGGWAEVALPCSDENGP